jgi:hypothetical protein
MSLFQVGLQLGPSYVAHLINNKLCIVNAKHVEHEKELLKKHFNYNDIGKVQDYIGCMIDI